MIMLPLQPYNLSSGFYDISYIVRYEDSHGYSSTSYVYPRYYSPQTQYMLRWLSFGEVYNISVRAQFRPSSGCYTYLYGEYSDAITVETIETGKAGFM